MISAHRVTTEISSAVASSSRASLQLDVVIRTHGLFPQTNEPSAYWKPSRNRRTESRPLVLIKDGIETLLERSPVDKPSVRHLKRSTVREFKYTQIPFLRGEDLRNLGLIP